MAIFSHQRAVPLGSAIDFPSETRGGANVLFGLELVLQKLLRAHTKNEKLLQARNCMEMLLQRLA